MSPFVIYILNQNNMIMYSVFYGRIYDGYKKILDTIDSCESIEHLASCKNLVENWLGLIDYYCDTIYYNRSNGRRRQRKALANHLAEASTEMYNHIKEVFEQVNADLLPEPYEGGFPAVRIRSLQEY